MALSHIDVRLDWLIANSAVEHGDAFRRLNAIENQLSAQRNVHSFLKKIDVMLNIV